MGPLGTGSSAGSDKPADGATRLAEGERVGPYRVIKVLGEGGMGIVYLAEHEMIARKAAIKILSAEVSGDAEAVSRFFTEARAVNQIRHPNIVEVTDLGKTGERPYIVMEYLEGETLGDRMARANTIDTLPAIHIVRQVASALGAAHEGGMVHRDLKPANIFLRDHPDYPDFVKVLDFGIAKLLKTGSDVVQQHHTRLGALIGTPAYMSPEQCLGEATLDHRSDVYSLGIVLYAMVTGRLPFLEDTLGRLIMAHVNDPPPPPAAVAPQVSREMSAVILKALEKKPQDRFATMKDLRRALDEVSGIEHTPTPVVRPAAAALARSPATPGPTPRGLRAPERPIPSVAVPAAPSPRVTTPVPVASGSTMAVNAAVSAAAKDEALFARLTGLVRDRLLSGKMELPRLSPASVRCLESLRSPEHDFGKLAADMAQDAAMSSRIIRLANSPVFQSRAPAKSLEQAIGRLGGQGLLVALIEFGVKPIVDAQDSKYREAFRAPWSHALAAGLIAEKLMTHFRQGELEAPAYFAALLHDIGKPIVAEFLLAAERQTSGMRGRKWMTDDVWLRTIAATFRPVSVEVAKKWRLPAASVRAIERSDAYQPDSGRSAGPVLRYALALAAREGYYLRRTDLEGLDADLIAGRAHLDIDEKVENKMLQGLKPAVTLLSTIRGA